MQSLGCRVPGCVEDFDHHVEDFDCCVEDFHCMSCGGISSPIKNFDRRVADLGRCVEDSGSSCGGLYRLSWHVCPYGPP